ncbi:MAG: cytidyltransferase [Candidatus Riflebacteria bacterium HGW-Riflebacteria-1]|nr:MAG: cytidyltransferase [Candidatus Riflebacteria bacterium HGW-Riflebacteria-1]
MKIGLTIGKYSPLHKGHQLVIETALSEVDKLYAMIYHSPETTDIPLPVRARWIRELYPQVTVVESWDGPTECGYTPEIMRRHDEYLSALFRDKNITHFYSSEPYGEHVSKALNARNRTVDIARSTVPISGTVIRADPYAARQYIADIVYRDHVVNAVFLGAPSTGKTVIAESLAADYATVWMPEYGREYWEQNQVSRRLTPEQLAEIARGHLLRENRMLLQARKYLFTDTNALTTRIFAYHYHGSAAAELEQIADACVARYDLYFVCDTDIPYEDSPDRSGDANRHEMQQQIIDDLLRRHIPYIVLSGTLEERKGQVSNVLRAFKKFSDVQIENAAQG